MIISGKLHLVAVLRLKIRRVTVKKGILPIILPNQTLKVLVLDD